MKKVTVAIVATLLLVACRNENEKAPDSIIALNRDPESTTNIKKQEEAKKVPAPFEINNERDKQEPITDSKGTQKKIPVIIHDWDKKIIKNATLNLEVKDFSNYNKSIREKIKQVGGYVAQEQQTETEYKIEDVLIIKVPVDRFDEAIQLLATDTEKLNEKRISSDDVTTEFVDTRSRLEAKKQVRLRYLDLLKQAKNMEEILSVQAEINGIQEEIESASGRIEYLSHSSSFSTINLTFYQVLNPVVADPLNPSFSAKFSKAFREGWSWIQEVFIILVSVWPLLLLVFAVYIMYRRIKRPKVKVA